MKDFRFVVNRVHADIFKVEVLREHIPDEKDKSHYIFTTTNSPELPDRKLIAGNIEFFNTKGEAKAFVLPHFPLKTIYSIKTS